MANDNDMLKDIEDLLKENNTKKEKRQGFALNNIYFYRYVEYNEKKLKKAKDSYIKKYGRLDNYA